MSFNQRKGMGNGLGRGRGQGDRPEAPDETATYTSKVKQQLKKGKAVSLGFTTPGKTVKGDALIDIQGEIDAGTADGRRCALQPEDPQEPREAHPVVLRPAQQGELNGCLRATGRFGPRASGCR